MKYLASFAIAVLICSSSYAQGLLFMDDFSSGADESWILPNDGWVWTGSALQNTSSCQLQTCMSPLFIGNTTWTTVNFKFDFTPTSAPSYAGHVVYAYIALDSPSLPAVGGSSGYQVDVGWYDEAKLKFKNGEPDHVAGEVLDSQSGAQFHMVTGNTYTFEFQLNIGDLSFRLYPAGSTPPAWQLTAHDERRASGYCGISTWETLGIVDNVVVTGYGVVSNEGMSWGGLKTLYR